MNTGLNICMNLKKERKQIDDNDTAVRNAAKKNIAAHPCFF
jgi:hypothetical protein